MSNSSKVRNGVYYDFGQDCTNFLSQVWNAAGILERPYAPAWFGKQANGSWTNTWTVVSAFRNYATNANYSDPWAVYQTADITRAYNPAMPGDGLMYDFGRGDGWSHFAVEIGWGSFSYSGSTFDGDYMDQHTTDRKHAPWNWGWMTEPNSYYRSKMHGMVVHVQK